jgi:hypothetical protein
MKQFMVLAGALALVLAPAAPWAQAQTAEEITNAVLPLPEDLRAGAAIYNYDEKGDRKVFRAGTNQVECMPKDPKDGFTRCNSKASADRRDFQAKLRAQGKSDKEVTEMTAAAVKEGKIKPPQMGTISYRYSDDPKRIKLLWVVSVPNQTPETLGVSTGSQRDAALKGHGMPWMMLPGTPGAHIMIPINNTPLSSTDK